MALKNSSWQSFWRFWALVGNHYPKYWAIVGNPSLKSITLVGNPIFEIFCSSWQSFFEVLSSSWQSLFEINNSSWLSYFKVFCSSWQSFFEIYTSSWQSFPKPWVIIFLSTLLWSLVLFSYLLRISKNVSVKKVFEFHSVAYKIQPMFKRSSISFCLLSRLITVGKANKKYGGPCTFKVFGLEMCKEIL